MKKIPFILSVLLVAAISGAWIFADQDLYLKAKLAFVNASGANTILIHAGNANALQVIDDSGSPLTYWSINSTAPAFTVSQPLVASGGFYLQNVSAAQTSTGTACNATPFAIAAAVTEFTTVGATTASIFPTITAATVGQEFIVGNSGANALTVCPPTGGFLNNQASLALPANRALRCTALSAAGRMLCTASNL